jgi:hypothetical protein
VEPRFANDYGHLKVGRAYRLARDLVDVQGTTRPAGDVWVYLGSSFVPYHDGLTLYVFRERAIEGILLEGEAQRQVSALEPAEAPVDAAAFGAALGACIRGEHLVLRQLALEIVSRTTPPPPLVAFEVGRRVQDARAVPLDDESLLVLMALYNVATDALHHRDDVAAIAGGLKQNRSERGKLTHEIARAILARMDAELDALKRRWQEQRRELEAIARRGDFAAAEARLAEWFPDRAPDGGVLSRAALCDEAGDQLRDLDRAAARWLYRAALVGYQMWASWSSSGAEGMSRMVDVRRLIAKQL